MSSGKYEYSMRGYYREQRAHRKNKTRPPGYIYGAKPPLPTHCDLCKIEFTPEDPLCWDSRYPLIYELAERTSEGGPRYSERIGAFHEQCRATHRHAVLGRVAHARFIGP